MADGAATNPHVLNHSVSHRHRRRRRRFKRDGSNRHRDRHRRRRNMIRDRDRRHRRRTHTMAKALVLIVTMAKVLVLLQEFMEEEEAAAMDGVEAAEATFPGIRTDPGRSRTMGTDRPGAFRLHKTEEHMGIPLLEAYVDLNQDGMAVVHNR